MKIGDGRNVIVWEDYWLENHRRLGPKPDNCEVIYVRDLLDDDGDDWNKELLVSLLPNEVANKISRCLVNQMRTNTLYWLNTPHGCFSSKMAYYLALDSSDEIDQNVTPGLVTLWRDLWKANVPNKVKKIVWRALHNYVPTVDNMHIRGLTLTSVTSTHCGEFGEEVMHVLYKCSTAKDAWIRCGFDYLYERNVPDTLEHLCSLILDNHPSSWATFMMMLWGLWTRRNKNFHGQHGGRDQEAVDVVVKRMLAEYHKANQKDMSRARAVQETRAPTWTNPQPN